MSLSVYHPIFNWCLLKLYFSFEKYFLLPLQLPPLICRRECRTFIFSGLSNLLLALMGERDLSFLNPLPVRTLHGESHAELGCCKHKLEAESDPERNPVAVSTALQPARPCAVITGYVGCDKIPPQKKELSWNFGIPVTGISPPVVWCFCTSEGLTVSESWRQCFQAQLISLWSWFVHNCWNSLCRLLVSSQLLCARAQSGFCLFLITDLNKLSGVGVKLVITCPLTLSVILRQRPSQLSGPVRQLLFFSFLL